MAEYKRNSEKNKMQPYELPSTPGAVMHLPSRLGYGARIRVRSAAYKVHVEQDHEGTDRVFQTVDPAAAERELLVQAILDTRSYHNLTENGRPIQMNRYWIEYEMDEDDALYLGSVLMNEMQDEIGASDEDGGDGTPTPAPAQAPTSPESSSPLESPVEETRTESGTSSPETSSPESHNESSRKGKKSD